MAYKTVKGTRLYYEIRGNEEGEKTEPDLDVWNLKYFERKKD